LLATDAVALTDGGPTVRAARRPLYGLAEIVQVTLAVVAQAMAQPGRTLVLCNANGLPALMHGTEGRIENIITLLPDEDGQVVWMYTMRAPEKLVALN